MQNMKKNTKVLALILAAMMTLSSFASCSDKGTNGGNDSETTGGDAPNAETASSGEETTAETEEERIKPDIPATADYGGDEINFLFWQLSSWMGTVRQCRDIYSEGITGEAINDAVYNRNIKIEDAYKVKIALEMMDLDKISTAISQEVNGGTNTYDVMYPRLYDAPSLYQKAYFHNIKKIPNIDLEKPWWDSNYKNAIALLDWAFSAYGYRTVLSRDKMICELPVNLSSTLDYVTLVPASDITVYLPTSVNLDTEIRYSYNTYEESLDAPVESGQNVGNITVLYGDAILGSCPLITTSSITRSEFLYFLQRVKNFTDSRFFRGTVVGIIVISIAYALITAAIRERKLRHSYSSYRRR